MALKDVSKYNALVGRVQGGNEFYMKSGGKLEMAGGSELEMEATTNFDFYGTSYTANEILNFIASLGAHTHHPLTGSYTSVSTFSPTYGVHTFSLATDASKASMQMPAASKGMMLIVDAGALVGDAELSLSANLLGLIQDQFSDALSTVVLSAAEALVPLVFVCNTDGTWQIVDGSYQAVDD